MDEKHVLVWDIQSQGVFDKSSGCYLFPSKEAAYEWFIKRLIDRDELRVAYGGWIFIGEDQLLTESDQVLSVYSCEHTEPSDYLALMRLEEVIE